MKCTCDCFLTKPTVPGPDFYFNAKWVPNLQFRWSFHQNLPSHCSKFESTVAYIFQFSQIVLIMSHTAPIGIRHEVIAIAPESRQENVTLVAWVWLVLPSTISSGSMLPLELCCLPSPQGLLGRPLIIKTTLCWGWSDRIKWSGIDGTDEKFVWNEGWWENNRLSSCGDCTYKLTRKPLQTANHCRLRLRWKQR